MTNTGYPGGNHGFNSGRKSADPPLKIESKPLPEDYVSAAESTISDIKNSGAKVITTTKLRNLFGQFSELYNVVKRGDADRLSDAQKYKLQSAYVRIVYEVGRERNFGTDVYNSDVGRFVKNAQLLNYLKDIGDSAGKFINFYHYFEALVAYHRFYFGESK